VKKLRKKKRNEQQPAALLFANKQYEAAFTNFLA